MLCLSFKRTLILYKAMLFSHKIMCFLHRANFLLYRVIYFPNCTNPCLYRTGNTKSALFAEYCIHAGLILYFPINFRILRDYR